MTPVLFCGGAGEKIGRSLWEGQVGSGCRSGFALMTRCFGVCTDVTVSSLAGLLSKATGECEWWVLLCFIRSSVSCRRKVSQSLSQPVSLSVSQSASQSISQSVSQRVSLSVCQSVSQLVSQSVSLSVSQSVSQPVSQSTSQSASLSVSQSVS